MKSTEMQITWAAAGFYAGGIDGKIGPKSRKAVARIEQSSDYSTRGMSEKRQLVAATQWCLNKLGFQAGAVDGYAGHNTRNALDALLYKLVNGKVEVVERHPTNMIMTGSPSTVADIPKQSQVHAYYGDPRGRVPSLLVTIKLPFKLRIDWNLNQRTNKMTVHQAAAPSLEAAMIAVHKHYGEDEWRRLGMDRYAGGYNKRKMRGGSKWSMHAYGCAVDFYAAPNGLRTRCPDALFCGPEYRAFLDIMQEHQWLPAIRLWGADAMHFQRATL